MIVEFTGKERDAESGLDYFGARYMSSAQGRWTSPDSINLTDERVFNPSNTLNKYIYGGNNPLKYTDPDGRAPFGLELPAGMGGRGGCYTTQSYPSGAADGLGVKFTSKERDAETGLDFFGARYFSSAQGRFTSPDWSAVPQPVPYADLTDPQTLNLYSYVRNNPLRKADPDGHCGIIGDSSCTWSDFLSSVPQRVIGGLKFEANAALQMVGVGPKFTASNAEQADAMQSGEDIKPLFQTGLAMAIPGPKGLKEPVEPFEVGEYSTLKSRSVAGDELDIHHVGQQNPMKQVVQNYDPKTAPSIALPESVHENIPTQRGSASTSARGQLAKDARDLRNAGVPNKQVQKVIDSTNRNTRK